MSGSASYFITEHRSFPKTKDESGNLVTDYGAEPHTSYMLCVQTETMSAPVLHLGSKAPEIVRLNENSKE